MRTKMVIALGALVAAASLYADSWLQGSVIQVNEAQKTVVIDTIHSGQVAVKILPTTKVELDDCGWFGLADSWIFSDTGNFWDIKVGRYVEIDGYYPAGVGANASNTTATKVEVKCRPRAY